MWIMNEILIWKNGTLKTGGLNIGQKRLNFYSMWRNIRNII